MRPRISYHWIPLTILLASSLLWVFPEPSSGQAGPDESASETEHVLTERLAADGNAAWFRVTDGKSERKVSLYQRDGFHSLLISRPNGAVEAARFACDDPHDPRVYYEMVVSAPEPTDLTESLLRRGAATRLPLQSDDERLRRTLDIFDRAPAGDRLLLTQVEEELARSEKVELENTEAAAGQRARNYFCRKVCLDSVCAACMRSWCNFTKCLPRTGQLIDCHHELQQINAYCGGYGGAYTIRRVRSDH